jgi:GNAT superfamily N-acetyltransferase
VAQTARYFFVVMTEGDIEYRRLARSELARIREIDRTERIDVLYVQRGDRLERKVGDWSAPPWDPDGDGEHSVAAQEAALEREVEAGAIALGAFAGERLVGIGVVALHLKPGVAQLTYLYVSAEHRASGIGGRLSDELERIARAAGDTEMIVSATPSENTVRFYRRRGFEPMAEPLPELLELEPEDVHMHKAL